MRKIIIKVKPQIDRLDKFLAKELKDFSRSQIQNLIDKGLIRVNQEQVDSDYHLRKNDAITVQFPTPKPQEIKAENIPLDVVFEDKDILVINKPAGLVVHPSSDHPDHTLVNALLYREKDFFKLDETLRPGIVHRLDKDTSGLLVIAKNQEALEFLKSQFKKGQVHKKYVSLVHGKTQKEFGEIDKAISRHPINRMKFAEDEKGRKSKTSYQVLKHFDKFTLLELSPKTGRTHQLRVHLSNIGHPIVGDKLYGGKMLLPRQFLHAAYLSFIHPQTKLRVKFEADLPPDLKKFLESFFSAKM